MTAETERCPAVYDGELWKPRQCREEADHAVRDHVDRYTWEGTHYADEHAAHGHHVDEYGRTWRAAS